MYKAMGKHKKVIVYTDSSACNGILHREGCGKVKHLEARQLWTQPHVTQKNVDVQKIRRERNPSDCFTHHWSVIDGQKHFDSIGLKFAR